MYYLKLYYEFLYWEWYTDANVMRLFIHCLLKANRKNKSWKGVKIKAGSFATSYENLASETGLTVMQVRTAIKKLNLTGEITSKTTSRYSMITINNWSKYQADNKQNNKQITNKQQTNNKQITTTRECIECKNDNYISDEMQPKKIKNLTDPCFNDYITYYQNCYKEIMDNNNCYLIKQHRDKLNELGLTLGNEYFEAVKTVLLRLKKLKFDGINFKPNTTWLLKDDNFIKVLEGSFEEQDSHQELKSTIMDKLLARGG